MGPLDRASMAEVVVHHARMVVVQEVLVVVERPTSIFASYSLNTALTLI